MRAPFTQLYVHCVWSTWDRLPLISPAVEPRLYACLAAKCVQLGCEALAVGGTADHVHVLVQFPPKEPIARIVGEMKGASSHLMTHEVQPGAFFKWQGSYGAFTVSQLALDLVRQYIRDQKMHHAGGTLRAELEPDMTPR